MNIPKLPILLAVLFIVFSCSTQKKVTESQDDESELVYEDELDLDYHEEEEELIAEPEVMAVEAPMPAVPDEKPANVAYYNEQGEPVYELVSRRAEPPGGWENLDDNLQAEMVYDPPSEDRKIFLRYTVSSSGEVVRAYVLHGYGAQYESEAIRALSNLKGWTPALVDGEPVHVQMVYPVRFYAEKEDTETN